MQQCSNPAQIYKRRVTTCSTGIEPESLNNRIRSVEARQFMIRFCLGSPDGPMRKGTYDQVQLNY